MFWLNRYVERAISIIRVVDVTAHLELDSGDPDASGIDYWTPLLRAALDTVPHDGEDESPTPLPQDVRYYLAFDPDNSTSLLSCIRQARSAAGEVRDLEEDLHAFYRQVRDSLLLIQGLDIGRDYHDVWPTRARTRAETPNA